MRHRYPHKGAAQRLQGVRPRGGGGIRGPLSLLQAGSLIEIKKVPITLYALAKIRETYPQARLTVIGSGPDRPVLEALCARLGLQSSVTFTGQLPHKQVLAEMGRSQFFVMPSVREAFGIVYLEAMASGCITIGTEGEGIADLIVSGENGFLVPPDNPDAIARAVIWCLEHPEEAAAVAERGREDAQGLTWEKNAKSILALFEDLAAKR